MRIGVLSDLHCELEPTGSRWINVFEPERLDERLDAALAWFAEARVDLTLLLGDVVQLANHADLEHALARVAAADVAPIAVVGGNHDLRLGDEFAAGARRHGMRLLHEELVVLDGIASTGVAVGRGVAPPQYLGELGGRDGDARLLVVASHFPIVSEASRLASAGLPYPGDLVNRADLESQLADDRRPKVVLSGHIHARCSTIAGSLLQLTVGALIEPPFDATIVEIDPEGVSRSARRLGPVAETDPVFAADEERWRLVHGGWSA
jgi:predicted phosphodiesterase